MGLTRAFAALALPEAAREALAGVAEGLAETRTVDADNLHLTLAFLGEVDDRTLEEVHDALGAIRAPGFDLRISGLGTFGGREPRVLWAGVEAEPRLAHLQRKVETAVRRAGAELPGKRFVPHVTLARFRPGARETDALRRLIAARAGLTLAPFPVRSFGLYASHRTDRGPDYEELAAYPLAAA